MVNKDEYIYFCSVKTQEDGSRQMYYTQHATACCNINPVLFDAIYNAVYRNVIDIMSFAKK